MRAAPAAVCATVNQELPQLAIDAVTPATVNVPSPRLFKLTPENGALIGGAPCARRTVTGPGSCAMGCAVTFMVTAMLLLSPAKVELLKVIVPV